MHSILNVTTPVFVFDALSLFSKNSSLSEILNFLIFSLLKEKNMLSKEIIDKKMQNLKNEEETVNFVNKTFNFHFKCYIYFETKHTSFYIRDDVLELLQYLEHKTRFKKLKQLIVLTTLFQLVDMVNADK